MMVLLHKRPVELAICNVNENLKSILVLVMLSIEAIKNLTILLEIVKVEATVAVNGQGYRSMIIKQI